MTTDKIDLFEWKIPSSDGRSIGFSYNFSESKGIIQVTPEKLSEWKKVIEDGTEHDVVEMALTAVPELIAEVERLQRKNEELQGIVDDQKYMQQEMFS